MTIEIITVSHEIMDILIRKYNLKTEDAVDCVTHVLQSLLCTYGESDGLREADLAKFDALYAKVLGMLAETRELFASVAEGRMESPTKFMRGIEK